MGSPIETAPGVRLFVALIVALCVINLTVMVSYAIDTPLLGFLTPTYGG
jgi:hypothetical protein